LEFELALLLSFDAKVGSPAANKEGMEDVLEGTATLSQSMRGLYVVVVPSMLSAKWILRKA
jgi:hypothetical protein